MVESCSQGKCLLQEISLFLDWLGWIFSWLKIYLKNSLEPLLKNEWEVRYTQKHNPGHFECRKLLATDLADRKKPQSFGEKNQTLLYRTSHWKFHNLFLKYVEITWEFYITPVFTLMGFVQFKNCKLYLNSVEGSARSGHDTVHGSTICFMSSRFTVTTNEVQDYGNLVFHRLGTLVPRHDHWSVYNELQHTRFIGHCLGVALVLPGVVITRTH